MIDERFRIKWLPYQREIFFGNDEVKYIIVPKGRRVGFTEGAEKACVTWSLEGITPNLWIDTINGNIERYFERYFIPDLRKLPKSVKWDWNVQKKILYINDSVTDFRSADAPESIEGFGYKKIILNEAGIILKDNYLYSNAILPMLLDYPDSQLIAAGVPKGKHKKDGTKHIFYQLFEKAESKLPGYKLLQYTSYANPLLDPQDIKDLEHEMFSLGGRPNVDQEIYGMFVEYAGENPFCNHYDHEKHESELAVHDANKQLHIWTDFNINPFSVNFNHVWNDDKGAHVHMFDEADIKNGSIPALIELVKARYGNQLHNCRLTGDKGGDKRSIEQVDNASQFIQLKRGLGLRDSQVVTHANPKHSYSRGQCNYFLFNFPDFKINPKKCPNTCRDLRSVQANGFGDIIKTNRAKIAQQADHLDCFRYGVNDDPINDWIKFHSKFHGKAS